MFAPRYFPTRYFPPRYFHPADPIPVIIPFTTVNWPWTTLDFAIAVSTVIAFVTQTWSWGTNSFSILGGLFENIEVAIVRALNRKTMFEITDTDEKRDV